MKKQPSNKMRLARPFLRKFLTLATALTATAGLTSACGQDPKLAPFTPVKKVVVSTAATVSFNPKLDILFVIDDSGSMESKQANLAANAQLFVDQFKNEQFLDYHIGVVTSSIDEVGERGGNGLLVGDTALFIDRNTPNGLELLKQNIKVGTAGNSTEKFFDPVQMALTPPNSTGPNTGFLRADAHLATIFITDANDQSENLTTASAYLSFLINQLKAGDAKKIHPYAVIIPSTDSVCDRSGEDPPLRIEDMIKQAASLSFDLCDPAYGTKLAGLGADLAQKVSRTIYLTRPPDVNTITVTYGSQIIPQDAKTGWSFSPDQNAILLGDDIVWSQQPDGTTVGVSFTTAVY